MNTEIERVFDRYLPCVEAELKALLAPTHHLFDHYYAMMHYHLGWVDQYFSPVQANAGKRLRPLLCLLVCDASSGAWQKAVPAATALELIHNFSLVHDDIEDQSDTRRGRLTLWKVWGIAHAINVGDAMYTLSFQALRQLRAAGVDDSTMSQAQALVQSAVLEMCQGQYLDLEFEDRVEIDVALYVKMIENKTAALIACATELGAVIGGASPAIVEHYRHFGRELGLGFQIMDDILGIWGDPRITGKPICDDLRRKKKTLPVLHALETERKRGKRTLRDLYSREEIGDDDVERMLAVLEETGSHQYAQKVLSGYRARALEKLEATGIDNQSQQTLVSLSRNALDREY